MPFENERIKSGICKVTYTLEEPIQNIFIVFDVVVEMTRRSEFIEFCDTTGNAISSWNFEIYYPTVLRPMIFF